MKRYNTFSYKCRTGKRRFFSESSAFMEMLRLNSIGKDLKGEIKNVYKCEFCQGWHTTRQPNKEYEKESV